MSAVDEILQNIPISQLASQLGTDEQTAGAAATQAIPAILGGLQANAQDPAGAASLEGALGNHSPSLFEGGVDLNQVDQNDGQKIVSNIFGGHTDNVAQTLGGQGDLVQRMLPILAPIVMSYLARRMGGGGAAGGLLGSLLGGAGGGAPAGGGGIGGLMGGGGGGMLGGGQQTGSGNPVVDMLGGMLGGGRR